MQCRNHQLVDIVGRCVRAGLFKWAHNPGFCALVILDGRKNTGDKYDLYCRIDKNAKTLPHGSTLLSLYKPYCFNTMKNEHAGRFIAY
ncbi:MAG: hypothetical protein DRP66_05435 [Planctomycetota bacterium]|nr:MAG: hypothetical protein DRP66_05435 [Planctomycetota bacterium]